MPLLALLLIAFGALLAVFAPSRRVAVLTTGVASIVAWVLIARFAWLTPMSPSEPEWWGGLLVVAALAELGAALTWFLKTRRPGSATG
jgi:hypothetical protein